MNNFNKTHPELREGEMFLTVIDVDNFENCKYETKRLGDVAYTIDGRKLSSDWRPVFVMRDVFDASRKYQYRSHLT